MYVRSYVGTFVRLCVYAYVRSCVRAFLRTLVRRCVFACVQNYSPLFYLPRPYLNKFVIRQLLNFKSVLRQSLQLVLSLLHV